MAARWTPPRHLSDPKLRQVFSSLGEHLVDPDDVGVLGEQFDEFESLMSPKLMVHVHWRTAAMTVPNFATVNDYVTIVPTSGNFVRGGGSDWLTISGAAFTVHETGAFRLSLGADFNQAGSVVMGGYSVNSGGPVGLFTAPNTFIGTSGYGERVHRLNAGDVVRFRVGQMSGSSLSMSRAVMCIERVA